MKTSVTLKGDFFTGGGTGPSIADLLVACTLQQTALAGADHSSEKSYLERVTGSVPDYADVNQASQVSLKHPLDILSLHPHAL